MTQATTMNDPRRLVGWLAVAGAVLAWSMAVLVGAAASFDDAALARPSAMLAFGAASQNLYRLAWWADILGWYVPFLAVGGYLWGRMRQREGARADIALAAIVVYAVLGIVGAGLLSLTLPPLAELHGGPDPMARVATEAIWTSLQGAAQGIWNAEAPVFLLWGIATARFLRAQQWGFGRLLTLDLGLFAIEFIFNLSGWGELGEMVQMATLVIHPLWLFLFGITLLRERAPALVGAGMATAA